MNCTTSGKCIPAFAQAMSQHISCCLDIKVPCKRKLGGPPCRDKAK